PLDKGSRTGQNGPMTVCRHVYYTGRVQGVGFRYTAQRLAESFPVSGYVRNLSDGRVELVAEGEQEDVESFLAAVARRLTGYIEVTAVRSESPGRYTGFRIRH